VPHLPGGRSSERTPPQCCLARDRRRSFDHITLSPRLPHSLRSSTGSTQMSLARPVLYRLCMSILVGFARTVRLAPSASALVFLVFGAIPSASLAGDLSKYRQFQLGTDLATIAKQSGTSPAQAKAIHRRPVLIQELDWRPQPLGQAAPREPAKDVVFSFYDGQLFRIVVNL
jgi:hypothetical protein